MAKRRADPAPDDQLATTLIHHPYQAPAGFAAVPPAVHKGSTVIFPNVAAMRSQQWQDKSGYTYGLHGTPTTFTLEERLATLEGARFAQLAPSGLSAIAMVNAAFLQAGDEVLLPDNAYGPHKELARHELQAWGIAHRFYDPQNGPALAALITPQTKLIWLEAAGSVTLEFPDLLGLIRAARAHPHVVLALDNTWGAGIAFQPFALPQGLGVDVSLHALTKYPSGGADVLMGSVCSVAPAVHRKIQHAHMRLGLGVGGNDAELVLRGLNTLPLRYAAQDQAARELASWLSAQPEVAAVLHPALPGSPGHQYWRQCCRAAAGLLSIVFQPGFSALQVDAFVDALRLFKIGYSWGGPMSLAMPYDLRAQRSLGWPHTGGLVRLCIGLESVADLQRDCAQALEVLRGA